MTDRLDVFFYGLFMDAGLLEAKGVHVEDHHVGWLENTRLFVGARAGLTDQPGSRAYGVVMSLPRADVEALYADDSLRSYQPEEVEVVIEDGRTRSAVCYNVRREDAGEPDPGYASRLREVARRVGLPDDYV